MLQLRASTANQLFAAAEIGTSDPLVGNFRRLTRHD
jgi:hypothetical protein